MPMNPPKEIIAAGSFAMPESAEGAEFARLLPVEFMLPVAPVAPTDPLEVVAAVEPVLAASVVLPVLLLKTRLAALLVMALASC